MHSRDVVGFALVPLALLAAGWLAKTLPVWSQIGGHTIPWFCSALAIALLVAGGTSLLCGQSLATIPTWTAVLAAAGAILVVGIGFLVDYFTYFGSNERTFGIPVSTDWGGTIGEWVGFAVLVVGCFWLPRAAANQNASSDS